MNELKELGIRNIILTSGTLSPMDTFQDAMGLDFPVRLENSHVVSAQQLWSGVIKTGATSQLLNSSFKHRSNDTYLTELGRSIASVMRVVCNACSDARR